MLTAGVDIGARTVDVVVLDADASRVLAGVVRDAGPRPREAAEAAFAEALALAGVERAALARVVATGYGRNHFAAAQAVSSEIVCHALGAARLLPDADGVVDIGGQDSKAIALGPGGRVLDFAMNDRCAAGTGRFIEMTCAAVGVELGRSGEVALASASASEISSMCAVFAESEIVGLLQGGASPGAILKGVFRSVARRTASLLARVGEPGKVVFTGGVALNRGVVQALREELPAEVFAPEEPQLAGALGAALSAAGPRPSP